ncbi:tRNA epoxyqueuosine(34) reductase QueG [Desulfosporosinus fructosivorans]|uniref:tRNA epoxyqueuosine(34) reductase QueG n=1 Tax=Desulfosporosinus fructosivorans TaxID=2018669 RepID=A0A4Z0R6Y9_9FIRM|nr:tRNA epoxyqueuosine(34) reductase QueG [Desulfosporosinus fructosivorans]TGE38921.1 tRNA epoxyqueuosine(34) reductase QueG [Desulfosporosinus fructosivorans]
MNFLDQMQWKTKIKRWGQELGFVSIGFTTAEPINSLVPLLEARIDQGVSTPFESKEIKSRIDPKEGWHCCQTVVALAYPFPYASIPQEGKGVIARSAVGEDYHHFMEQKINHLVEIMANNDWPGTIRLQVDTGPLIERAFALRAGIGWIGRNQNLIIPGYGSFVALALLLLDQAIEPDHPSMLDQCGTCLRCVQACPAQILGKDPFAAKHCVSYLTQSKEVLTPEECERLGLRVFGCDTCQEVCPHNQTRIEEELAFSSDAKLQRGVDLMVTLNLTKGEFQRHFKATAAGWRGKGVLQRNAFLALRNLQDGRSREWLNERENDQTVPPIITPYRR